MADYSAPVEDMGFVITELTDLEQLAGLECYAEYEINAELLTAVLDEASKFAGGMMAPYREQADSEGCAVVDGAVTLPAGYSDIYKGMVEGGWCSVSMPVEYGGQGLPEVFNTACVEMWTAADMAFSLGPFLTQGASLAIHAHGSDALKDTYLPMMVTGEWSGTMNLTEPQAGSDLSTIKSRAEPEGDHYRIYGQKIFITWGDNPEVDNVVHLVLARLPDAPAGTAGISLFLVPKFLVNEDGSLGARNDVYPISTEHKLGIHGSPTCVMGFGEKEGAIGYLVGAENRGLACMFTMMNEARLKVGMQGLGVAEGAYQHALAYARDRVQGRHKGQSAAIIQHADVKRQLMTMKSLNEAMRAVALVEAVNFDMAHNHADSETRASAQARVDLMIPVIKGWLTELGQEVASHGVQIYGGMGFIEETGAAQFLRDVRIAAIYEGTNGIQAADLLGRKVAKDGGKAVATLLEGMLASLNETKSALAAANLGGLHESFAAAVASLRTSTETLLARIGENPDHAMASSFDYMMQMGYTCGAWQMVRAAARAAELAADNDRDFYRAKIESARFYGEQIVPRALALGQTIQATSPALVEMDTALF